MTAGLPGTGIGGLFYILLVLAMPLREFVRTCRGRTSLARWRFVGLHLASVIAILVGMWGTTLLIIYLLRFAESNLGSVRQTKTLATASAIGAFVSLCGVLFSVHLLRMVVRCKRNRKADASN